MVVELFGLAHLFDFSVVEHGHAGRHLERLFLVVRDENARQMQFVMQTPEPSPQFLAYLGVERAKRFVEQQHAWLDRQCARQCDALSLPAGKLRRIALAGPFELHKLEQLVDRDRISSSRGRVRRGLTRNPKATFSKTVMWRKSA